MPNLVVLGARNLGGAILDRFLADGWEATAVVRSADTCAAVEARGARAIRADVRDPAALAGALEAVDRIDCLVNAVSVASFDPTVPWGGGPLAEATLARYRAWSTAVTEQAFVFFSEAARRLLAQGGPATVLQVGNRASREAAGGMGLWAAGWHGVRALARAATQELAPHGVHVALLVVNGPIASPKTRELIAGMAPDEVNDQAEVAAAVAYLASQEARGRSTELTLTPAAAAPAPWS
jgi:3-oxoacyl-[acyl-carrier protein] reductase